MATQHQLLSALVVFDLFKKQGKQLPDILESFIIFATQDKAFISFTHIEINDYLKDEFGFEIPTSVIERRLKKMVKNGIITYNADIRRFQPNDNANTQYEEIQEKINQAIQDEKILIEKLKSHCQLSLDENILREKIVDYFLGLQDDQEINNFVIKNRENSTLRNVSNGIILYNGLRYHTLYDNKRWEKLYIYINMEIIFHYMGYNGEMFSLIIKELFALIKEINKKDKKVIYLYYTSKEKQRIEDFFDAIIKNKNSEYTMAEKEIKKKCFGDEISIRAEKLRLFEKLEKEVILKRAICEVDFNLEKNQKYNVASKDIEKEISNIGIDKIEFLNKLNILRANNEATIENAKYLFLTEEKEYIEISKYIKANIGGKIPIAIQTTLLTNILWLKLGKLSKNYNELLIFKPDTRAKISAALNLYQHNIYLQEEIKKRKSQGLSEEICLQILSEIKEYEQKPEEINENNIDSLENISGRGLDYFIERQQKREQEVENLKNENEKKENDNKQLKEEREQLLKIQEEKSREIKELRILNKKANYRIRLKDYRKKKCLRIKKKLTNYYQKNKSEIINGIIVSIILGVIVFIVKFIWGHI